MLSSVVFKRFLFLSKYIFKYSTERMTECSKFNIKRCSEQTEEFRPCEYDVPKRHKQFDQVIEIISDRVH